jgi:hypothetical protein
MKKSLFFVAAMILLIGISCEKDTKLSEFAIGNWKSQELTLGDSPFGSFTATIKTTNKYVLTFTLSDGSQSISCPETGYTIDDDKDQITITEPDFDTTDNEVPTGTQTFDVTWKSGEKVMTWIPLSGGDAPTLVWTRQ